MLFHYLLRRSALSLLLLASAVSHTQAAPPARTPEVSFVPGRATRLQFTGDPTYAHRAEYSDDFQTWFPFPTSANPIAPGRFESFDPGSPGRSQRFYRVLSRYDSGASMRERVRKDLGNLGERTGSSSHSFTLSYPESLLAPVGNPNFGAGATASNRLAPGQFTDAYRRGLAAWRRVGNHGSCVGCHAPDAFDLALIGYSDADITRRALDHVTSAEAADIVQFVKAIRQKYAIERPLHPLHFRPLQPGGEVLPGANHAERDQAFSQYLSQELSLLWAKDRIESRAQALAAQLQFQALDLRRLRIGIPFDRWSEDGSRGGEHLSASEWIPMMGVQPAPGRAAEWHALHDAYLANPSDAHFWAYYDRIDEFLVPVEPPGFPLGQTWSLLKYKSVQVAQHMMRHQSLTFPDALVDRAGTLVANRNTVLARNPIFRTGDHVRRFPLQFDQANESTTFPAFLTATMPTAQNALRDQNENFFRVWFWMGWAYDPALLLSDSIFQTVEGDYLYSSTLQHYKIHHAFIVAMTSVAKANATAFFSAPGEGVAGHGKWASFTPFMVLHHIERNRNEPAANDPRRAAHDFMFSNSARMWIYLVQNDLERSGTVFDRELVRGCIRFVRAWLNDTEAGVDHAALDAVITDIETRLNTATELRTNFNTPDLPGGLPFNN